MGIFTGSKKPDTSAADQATRAAQQDRDTARAKTRAKIRNARNRARGRSLLVFAPTGLTGVKETLG